MAWVLALVALGAAALGLVYLALALVLVFRLARLQTARSASYPSVTVLKPLHGDEPMLEESVYLGSTEGPRRTVQIVIYGRARAKPSVHWTLARSSAAASEPRSGGAEPELPL